MPALATFAGALLFAVIAILLALGAFVVIWKDGIGGGGHAFAAIAIGGAAARLSGLSRRARLSTADDQRRHHRPDRSAALRRGGAAAPARHGRLCRPLCRRAAAQAYPDIEPLDLTVPPTGRLRRGAGDHHQAQVAGRGRPAAAGRAPRRPDRGGGAHPDHGLPRRRDMRVRAIAGRRAHRRALGLALRPPRFRHQRVARAQSARRHRRSRRARGGPKANGRKSSDQRRAKPGQPTARR